MTDVSSANTSAIEKTRTFLKSQFAEAKGISIEKSFTDIN
jgi:hypothetical protein